MVLGDWLNKLDGCDAVVIPTIEFVLDMTGVCGLDNMIWCQFTTLLFNLLTIDGGIEYDNTLNFCNYLMAGIAVCIIVYVRLENIHRIVRRRKTATVVEDVDLTEDRAAGAYGWILCRQFKWIAICAGIALCMLYWSCVGIIDELQNVDIILYDIIIRVAVGVLVIMAIILLTIAFNYYCLKIDDSSMNFKLADIDRRNYGSIRALTTLLLLCKDKDNNSINRNTYNCNSIDKMYHISLV